MTLLPLLAALVLAAPPAPAGPASPAAPAPLARALPLGARLSADLGRWSDVDLVRYVEHLRSRLFLDDATTVIEVMSELELALRFAVAVQLLEARAGPGGGGRPLRQAARQAAFLLHATGFVFETDEDVRASVEGLLPPPGAPNRAAVEELIVTLRGLRGYANTWLPAALAAERAGNDAATSGASFVQEGLWHVREGRPLEGAERLTHALAAAPSETVALAAYDALLQAGTPAAEGLAAELRDKLVARWPALAGRFTLRLEAAADARASARFEATREPCALDDCVAQVFRHLRLGRPGAADVLAKETLARFGAVPAAWHARAEVLLQLGRYESLRTLLLDAEAVGRLDARLREVRIAARTRLRVAAALGEPLHPLAEGDLEADLVAYVAAGGGAGSDAELLGRAARLFIAISGWLGARTGPDADVRLGAAERELTELLAARPKDPEALRLVLVGWAGLEQPARGLDLVAARAARLPAKARPAVEFLLARVEAGLALRERDPKRMKAALARFERLAAGQARAPRDVDRERWQLARTTAEVGAAALAGGRLDDALVARARSELAGLAFDEATHEGRTLAQAAHLTAAALAAIAGRAEDEVAALRAARAARREHELALLAGGLVQQAAGDRQGAFELWQRALERGSRPALRQWLAQAAGEALLPEEPLAARGLLTQALDLWDTARLPDMLAGPTVRPLLVGDFDIDLAIAHGEPLRLVLRANPVLVLLPEIARGRADLRARRDGLAPVPP